MEHLVRDLNAGQMKMTDTDAFAPGRNLALTPGQVFYRNRLVELIQYTPTTRKVYALPLLFIPPWINKYYILDMKPQSSLIKFLVENGFTVFVISWKNPDASMEEISFEGYLTLGPLSALDVMKEITGSPRINAVGYCIGGTLLSMTLPYLVAKGDEKLSEKGLSNSIHAFPNQYCSLKAAHLKKKSDCAMVNEARIESGGKQEHTLIRTEELIIRPFGKGDKELAKVK